jgi:hypothetical protein
VYASQSPSPTPTLDSLPGGRYGLTRAGLSPAGTRQLRLAHHKPSRGALQMFFDFLHRPLGALREVLSEKIFAACQFEAAIHLSKILLGYGSGLPPGT